jgi:hypothetical protein
MGKSDSPDTLPGLIDAVLTPTLRLTDAPEILCHTRDHDDGRRILLVNTTDAEVNAPARIPDTGTAVVYDPLNEESETVTAGDFTLSLPPYGAKLILL